MSYRHTHEKSEIDIEKISMFCNGCRTAEIEIPDKMTWPESFIGWSTVIVFQRSKHPLARHDSVEAGIENAMHFCPNCTKQRFA